MLIDAICLSEHFMIEGHEGNLNIDGYNLVASYQRKDKKRGGTCILLRQGIEYEVLNIASDLSIPLKFECCAVLLKEVNLIRHSQRGACGSKAPGAGRGGDAGAGAVGRPRPLVVRFTRRAVKDELTAAARVRRGATSADLSQSSAPRPFYVNERLTKYNRQLYYQTREVGRRLSWRFLWTKKGRIYARQGQDTPRHWIRSADDISRVFGVAS
ncbi:unnamed protein product [Plutella xylostella]|uniref:(diamondback moth) hypothetical protein n=1 Tax=Plutella xylostella TaxID=51655 RepID=A0A8S4GCQ8_PLUXY|nr:unnamed protein product [Plutella xylostella]